MKKILFLFSLFLLLSCSDSYDSLSGSADFHPPSWLQGNWGFEEVDEASTVVFSFSKGDLCLVSGISKQCYQELVNQMRKEGIKVKVNETITANTYIAEITYFAGQSVIYSFRKLSNNSIEWTQSPGSVLIKL